MPERAVLLETGIIRPVQEVRRRRKALLMSQDFPEYGEWLFWRVPPHAATAAQGIEIERFAAATVERCRLKAAPVHCSVFLEKPPSIDNATHQQGIPIDADVFDDRSHDEDASSEQRRSAGAWNASATQNWREAARPNRVGRLLRDVSLPSAVSSATFDETVSDVERPVGDASMGNRGSSQQGADGKRAKGSSTDALASETPRGSPGLFRLVGRDAKGKVKKTPQTARKNAPESVAAAPADAAEASSQKTPAPAQPSAEKRSESSPESSGSVYVDTVSHLPTPAEDDTGAATADPDSVTLQDSPSNVSDSTVFGDEDGRFGASGVDAPVGPYSTLPCRGGSARVRSFSEAESTAQRAPSCTSLGRGDVGLHSGAATPTFTLTQHRKVVLPKFPVPSSAVPPETPAAVTASSEDGGDAKPPGAGGRRHSAYDDVPPLDGNVLRKVASLTLDRATIEARVNRPKVVPEKLDFSLYEKFEGELASQLPPAFIIY